MVSLFLLLKRSLSDPASLSWWSLVSHNIPQTILGLSPGRCPVTLHPCYPSANVLSTASEQNTAPAGPGCLSGHRGVGLAEFQAFSLATLGPGPIGRPYPESFSCHLLTSHPWLSHPRMTSILSTGHFCCLLCHVSEAAHTALPFLHTFPWSCCLSGATALISRDCETCRVPQGSSPHVDRKGV